MGQTLLDKVLVEIDGRVDGLQRAAAAGGRSLEDLAGTAAKIGGPGGLGDVLGGLGGRLGGLSEALASPAAGAGILAVALTGLATEAIAMSDDVTASLRRVRDGLGETDPGALDRLRGSVGAVRAEASVAVTEVAHLFAVIEKGGAGSAAGVEAMARAVYLLRDADGGELEGLAGGLDAVLDTFGLASTEAVNVAARLSEVAKGKVPLEDLLGVFGKIAPVAQQNGLSFEQLVGVVGNLLDQNIPLKQVVSTVEALAQGGDLTAGAFARAQGELRPLNESVADLTRRADETRNATGRAAAALKEELVAAFVSVGDVLGGLLNGPLRDLRAELTDGIPGAVLKVTEALDALDRARSRGNTPFFGARYLGGNATDAILGQLLGNGGAVAGQLDAAQVARARAALQGARGDQASRLRDLNPFDDTSARIGQALSLLESRARELDAATGASGLVNRANQAAGEQLRRLKDQLKPENVPLDRLRALKAELQRLADSDVVSIKGEAASQVTAVDRRIEAATTKAATQTRELASKRKQRDQEQAAALRGFDSAIAAASPGQADNLETQIAALTAAAAKAGVGADVIAARTADLRKAAGEKLADDSRQLTDRLRAELVEGTTSAVRAAEQALQALDQQLAEARQKGLTPDAAVIAGARRLREDRLDIAYAEADLKRALAGLDEQDALGATGGLPLNQMRELVALQDQARAEADDTRASEEQRAAALERVRQVQQKINALQDKQAGANKDAADRAKQLESQAQRTAGAVANVANAAAGIAAAFAGGNSELARMLSSTAGVAGGIESLLGKAREAGGLGKLLSTGKGVAAAAGPLGAIVAGGAQLAASLFGGVAGSAQVKAAQAETAKAMVGLTEALYKLREAYLQTVSSTDATGDLAFAQRAAGIAQLDGRNVLRLPDGTRILRDGEGKGAGRQQNLEEISRALGLSTTRESAEEQRAALRRRLAQLDERYGTNLTAFFDSTSPDGLLAALRKLPAGIQDAVADLGRFGDDAAGVIARVGFEFDVLGKSDPADKVRATVAALRAAGKGLGEFQSVLDQLADPALDAGQREALVRQVLERLQGTGLNFGDLTPEQFRQLFGEAAKLGAGTAAGSGGFAVDRTITEASAGRLAGLLTTANVFHERTARAVEAIATGAGLALGPAGGATSAAPAGEAPVLVQFAAGAIVVQVPAGDAGDLSGRLSDAVVTDLARRLGRDVTLARLARGGTPGARF